MMSDSHQRPATHSLHIRRPAHLREQGWNSPPVLGVGRLPLHGASIEVRAAGTFSGQRSLPAGTGASAATNGGLVPPAPGFPTDAMVDDRPHGVRGDPVAFVLFGEAGRRELLAGLIE